VDGIVQGLRERIITGTLRPGMSLPAERELAGQLEVSRATLREGLSVLSHMGLVTTQRGRNGGPVVTAPPITTISASIALLFQTRAITAGQLVEFRRALEVEAAQLAAARRTDEELAEIAVALDAYVSSGGEPDVQNAMGRAFHFAVARASGNSLLAETMTSLNQAFAECFALQHAAPDTGHIIASLHSPILEAILRQDVSDARRTMLAHFEELERALRVLGLTDHAVGVSGRNASGASERG
jgi:DNA-binding FadR family transcriptional regulator